jgi:protein O-GlcNAc transferase
MTGKDRSSEPASGSSPSPKTATAAATGSGAKAAPQSGDHRGAFSHGLALLQAGNLKAAAEAFARACDMAPDNPDYRLHYGIALLNAGQAEAAADAFREVLTAQPQNVVALINLGFSLTLQKDYAGALDALRRAVEIEPDRVEAHFNLGNAERDSGDRDGALRSYRRALELRAGMLPAIVNLGGLLLDTGDPAEARRVFADGLRQHPDRPELQYGLALALEQIGDNAAAIAAYRGFLARWPDQRDVLNNLAGLLKGRGDESEATALYERAVALDPKSPEPAVNLAALYFKRHRRDDALRLLRSAMNLAAGRSDLLLRIANDLRALNDMETAIDCYRRVLDGDPGNISAHARLGSMLLYRDRLDTAREHLEFALSGSEDDSEGVLVALAEVEQKLRRPAESEKLLRRAIAASPERLNPRSTYLFALNYSDSLAPDAIAGRHRELVGEWAAMQPPPRVLAPASRAGRRLRVGYVSPDFRQHSCSYFFESLLGAHDRDRVEVWCYSSVLRPDAVTDRIRQGVEHWCDIADLDDEPVANMIMDRDGIDLLVDLAGHSANTRLALFARRIAPVQMTWLGYPNTTALPAMDHRITDAIADPPGNADKLYTERLIRIEGGFLAYRPAGDLPPVAGGPAARGGPIRFGCFNNALKLTGRTLELWASILARMPEARLVLRASALRDPGALAALRADLGRAGIDPLRVDFPDYAPTAAAGLEGYADIDVALDPTPYNGTTTTCEALWMGVPVVALAGDCHAARVGASLLHHAGLPELVADTPAQYAEIALELAADRQRLADLRRGLREHVAGSPLGDGRRLAASFERAFEDALAKAAA